MGRRKQADEARARAWTETSSTGNLTLATLPAGVRPPPKGPPAEVVSLRDAFRRVEHAASRDHGLGSTPWPHRLREAATALRALDRGLDLFEVIEAMESAAEDAGEDGVALAQIFAKTDCDTADGVCKAWDEILGEQKAAEDRVTKMVGQIDRMIGGYFPPAKELDDDLDDLASHLVEVADERKTLTKAKDAVTRCEELEAENTSLSAECSRLEDSLAETKAKLAEAERPRPEEPSREDLELYIKGCADIAGGEGLLAVQVKALRDRLTEAETQLTALRSPTLAAMLDLFGNSAPDAARTFMLACLADPHARAAVLGVVNDEIAAGTIKIGAPSPPAVP